MQLTNVDPLLKGQDLRRPGDELGERGGGEELRVGRVGPLEQHLALVEAVGRVLEGDQRLLGLGPLRGGLGLVELLA